MTPKTTAKKAEPDTSTVQTTEVKEAPAKTTVRKPRTTAKKTTEKPAAEKKPATEKKPAARRTVKKEVNAEVYVQFLGRGLCKGCSGKCEEDLDRRNGQERKRSEGC